MEKLRFVFNLLQHGYYYQAVFPGKTVSLDDLLGYRVEFTHLCELDLPCVR